MMAAWFSVAAGSALIAYILFVYPLLLAVLFRKRAPAPAKDLGYEPTVTVILAVYNGEQFIRAKLESLLALDYPREKVQILIGSDGSTDGTDAVVREFADRGVTLLALPRGGKAAALNAALAQASGEVLFFTDVRQPIDSMAMRHLVANLADPSIGAVTGELHLLRGADDEQADMDLYWKYEIWVRTRHSEIDSIFTATGCLYVIRRELAEPIPKDTLSDDAMIPLRAYFRGARVILDPQAKAFDYPAVAGTEFRRRMRTLAGLWQLHVRLPELFGSKNRMRFHFLSHKFSRLVLPWAILWTLLATLMLPYSAGKVILLAAQGASFGLAALDVIVPQGFFLKRLTSPFRTFVTLNAAAIAAMAVFFMPAEELWLPTRVSVAKKTE